MDEPAARPWIHPMRRALSEARACEFTGDVPVGAVVVDRRGTVIATGRNERELRGDPTAHAEILALRAAAGVLGGRVLDHCTLVVTLEPCPMCAGAVMAARIPRVVFGAWDPKAGACGSVYDIARDRRLPHRSEVVPGVLEDECASVLSAFFDGLTSRGPR